MADGRIGLVFVEVDLDSTKLQQKQQRLLDDIKKTCYDAEQKIDLSITRSFQNLGIQTDRVYQLMANKAIASYDRISKAANISAAEQYRAQAAMVAQINSLNMQKAANPLFETLGIRSVAAIEAQKEAVIRSFDTIKAHTQKGSQDWINIEHAKNRKLKELNKEMVGDHEMSMASMTRAVLRFYAAFYVITTAGRYLKDFVMSGVNSIDEMKTSVIAVAAQITSMQGTTGNVTENYRKNVEYAKALVPVLMQIDANSFANFEEIQLMNRAATQHGVILDINKQKQIESFTAITNAIRLLTTGQNKTLQASQEMRALTSGTIKATDAIALQIDSIIKQEGIYKDGLKDIVKLGKEHGDFYERLAPYLVGMVAASGDISTTWAAVSSSLETAWGIIQRGLFKDLYKDLTVEGQKAVTWMKANADEIIKSLNDIKTAFGFATVVAAGFAITMGTFAVIATFPAMMTALGTATLFLANQLYAGTLAATIWASLTSKAINTVTFSFKGLFAVTAAGFAGYMVGSWLNQFESVRMAGIDMVYGLLNAWNTMKTAALATAAALNPFTSDEEKGKRIAKINKDYADEKKRLAQFKAEQEKENLEINRVIKAQEKIATPYVKGTPASDETDPTKIKSAHKEAMDLLAERTAKIKESYEDSIAEANRWAATERENGANEWTLIQDLYDKKTDALVSYYVDEAESIENSALLESEKAKKLAQLDRESTKEFNKNLKEKEDATRSANKKYIEVMASVYKTLDQYSQESIDAELKSIAKKYDAEYALAKTAEDQKAVLNAKEKANSEYLYNLSSKKFSEEISYYEKIAGYEGKVLELKLKQIQADKDREIQSAITTAQIARDAATEAAARYVTMSAMADEAQAAIELAKAKGQEVTQEQQDAADKARAIANKTYQDAVDSANRAAQAQIDAQDKITAATEKAEQDRLKAHSVYTKQWIGALNSAADALESISKLYEEGSSQQKQFHQAAIAFSLAAKGIETALAVIEGVRAVMSAMANGDGYTAIARGLAVAAMVAGYLAQIGAAFQVSGASESVASLPKSTVLGAENGTVSQSISKSYELLQDTYDMENARLTELRNEMKDLNQNITGLVSSILRTGSSGINFDKYSSPFTLSQSSENRGIAISQGIGIFSADPFTTMTHQILESIFDNKMGKNIGESLFGGIEKSITHQGFSLGQYSYGDKLDIQNWARIKTEKSSGLFSSGSTNYSSQTLALTEEQAEIGRKFNTLYKTLSTSIVDIAKGLGTDIAAAENYIFEAATLNLKGMTAEEMTTAVNEYFSNLGDTAAKTLFEDMIGQYQKVGEALFETAVRVAQDKEIVLESLNRINQGFEGTAAEAISLSEALIEAAGDLSTLTDAWNVYFDKFFSAEEKQTYLQKTLTEQLAAYGEPMPKIRDDFKLLLQGIDKVADPQKYFDILKLAGGFDELFSVIDDSIEATKQALQDTLDLAKGDLQKAFEAAKATITSNYNIQLTHMNKVLSDLTESVNKLRAARERMNLVDAEIDRITFIRSKQALMKGVWNDDILDSVSSISPENYSSSVDYHRDYGRIYGKLLSLEQEAAGKVTYQQQHIDMLTKSYNFQIESMDKQYNALVGINNSVLSVTDAIVAYHRATAAVTGIAGPTSGCPLKKYAEGGEATGWGVAGDVYGPELVNFGTKSRVYSNKDSKSLLDIAPLIDEVKALRAEVRTGNTYQKKTADVLDECDRYGFQITWFDSVDSVRA